MAIWKVSYVVKDGEQAGGIINLNHDPKVGEVFQAGESQLEILEAFELIPPRGDFHYVHVTCRIQKDKR